MLKIKTYFFVNGGLSNKKIDDVIVLLSEITKGNHVETVSKVILGLLFNSIEKKEIDIQQVV